MAVYRCCVAQFVKVCPIHCKAAQGAPPLISADIEEKITMTLSLFAPFHGRVARLRRPVLSIAAAAALALACSVAPASFAQTAAPGTPAALAAAQPIKVALIESLSGPFANTGEAVYRNIFWAMERVNQRGGVALPAAAGGARPLVLQRYDSKGQNEEAL